MPAHRKPGRFYSQPSLSDLSEDSDGYTQCPEAETLLGQRIFKYSFLFNSEIKQLKQENKTLKEENKQLKKNYEELLQRIEALEKKIH